MNLSLSMKIAYILILGFMLVCSIYLITLPRELQVPEEYKGMIYVDEAGILKPKYERVIVQGNGSGGSGRYMKFTNKTNMDEVNYDNYEMS
jgi:hypothetical protein